MDKPDICKPMSTPYNELIGAENTIGISRQGGELIEYLWREDGAIDADFEKTKDNLILLLGSFTGNYPSAKGLLVYFDVMDNNPNGTTTFGELFVDTQQKIARLIIYSIITAEMINLSYIDTADLRVKLNWYDSKFKTLSDDGITFIGSVTYRRFENEQY